ncbi:guanylate-binding protein [Nitzschia inconspicua]|uniref:Guanylate-binding protein n=1 Tax=Nitzschia inconspicua TaxID=303405 RepID=A0A9K3L7U3_9STRA|nr:guanylate-binding protein [Nitzschia inconspicua]
MTVTEKDDVVLVEHRDISSKDEDDITSDNNVDTALSSSVADNNVMPEPFQIVSIGSADDKFAFTFHEDKLNLIMQKIPPGWKVAVVSVVGAFRTGKSFLLSWFLTYLHHLTTSNNEKEEAELVDEDNDGVTKQKWFETIDSIGNKGFHWRGGKERNTTGIWMWSQPHFVRNDKGETMAVLLVDSQGMFDNETTMALTTSIFGLSTLLSSYQIYNVDKRIQEDNLQQLALFSEYARLAVQADSTEQEVVLDEKPFQTMEFLVRDWQHFEEEEDYDQMEKEMADYLDQVISEREAKDLQETREQIMACFQTISCFGLSHPGLDVPKKNFQGEVAKIDDIFLNLLDRYCRRVFSVENLKPKIIHGREVTAVELGAYIKAYAEMFANGASFPEASTMLEATSAANNTNAVNMAIAQYKDTMSRIAGPKCNNYIRPKELQDDHRQLMTKSLAVFDSVATFGSKRAIEGCRQTVIDQLNDEFEVYASLNAGRNPLAGFETYAIPLSVAAAAYILRAVADFSCSPYSQMCRNTSELLSHIYAVVVCFLVIVGFTKAKQVKELYDRIVGAFKLVVNDGGKQKKD